MVVASSEHEFEKVFKFKTRQVYFIYPFLRRLKVRKSFPRKCVNFFSLKLTFLTRKVRILEVPFCKTRTDYACKTLWTRLATGKNFSFNHCHTKSFAFFLGKFIL